MEYKRILIVSANPTSNIFNNGKTLSSFFDNYPSADLAQLYFSTALPDSDICSSYFRISDMDMLNYHLKRKKCPGEIVEATEGISSQTPDEKIVQNVKKNDLSRLLREGLWSIGWNTMELNQWLDEFSPEVVFFLAGDAVFGYRICKYIVEKYQAKFALYITDDYILPRPRFDLWGAIRRSFIRSHMRDAVLRANLFFTISPKMKECYRAAFHKDSFVIANMHEATFSDSDKKNVNPQIVITYAGGLHFHRYKTVYCLAKVLDEINKQKKCDRKIALYVYTGSQLPEDAMKKFNQIECLQWGGLLSHSELDNELKKSDYLLHVESFDKDCICETRLSLSTKIPEYMSYKKPIIAIGPEEVASMEYLKDCSCCIYDIDDIEKRILFLVSNSDEQKVIVERANIKYMQNHDKKSMQPKIIEMLCTM